MADTSTRSPPSTPSGAQTKASPHGRGPAYPFIPLDKALVRAEELKKQEGWYAVPREAAYKAWGLGEKSSGARQTLAALKHFGLVEYIGLGESAKVKLSDIARNIILDVRPDSEERFSLIRQAAFTPPIHAELAREYPHGLPSDTTIQVYLTLKKGFNEGGAKDLIAEYRRTLAYLEEVSPEKKSAFGPPPSDEAPPLDEVDVGDLVQAEVGGVHQFAEPKRVRATQAHQGRTWVFVDGEKVGYPIEQITVVSKGDSPTIAPSMPLEPPLMPSSAPRRLDDAVGFRREIFSLDEGEVTVTLPEKLSKESVEDLKGHFDMIWRKEARRARTATAGGNGDSTSAEVENQKAREN